MPSDQRYGWLSLSIFAILVLIGSRKAPHKASNQTGSAIQMDDTSNDEVARVSRLVVTNFRPDRGNEPNPEWFKDHTPRWKKRTEISAIIVALLLLAANGFIAVANWRSANAAKESADSAKRAIVIGERAWIAPNNAYITSELKEDVPLALTVEYRNVGKSPAFDVHPTYLISEHPGTLWGEDFNQVIERKPFCNDVQPRKGADVVYNLPEANKFLVQFHDTTTIPIDADLRSGNKWLVVRMCFAYRTMEETHHSSFCYLYRKGFSPANLQMAACPVGTRAD